LAASRTLKPLEMRAGLPYMAPLPIQGLAMAASDDTPEERNLRVMARWRQTGRVLIEALPYILKYDQKTVVVKYGGNAMTGSGGTDDFSQDIVLMKQTGIDPVVVHGGGPQIGAMLKKMNINSTFIDGLRVTDEAAVEIVEMVLTGSINKQIVSSINVAGGRAVGLSGKDGNLVVARKLALSKTDPGTGEKVAVDLGFVGEPEKVNPEVLHTMMKSEIIPVIAPIGVGPKGETFNINADTVAGAVAGAVKAERLILLTDVEGVLDKDKKLVPKLTVREARALIADGTISGGMIPKIQTAIDAVEAGVTATVILDGRIPHVLLLELFTEHGAGTLITAE
jgi:acetylglutamate kinase